MSSGSRVDCAMPNTLKRLSPSADVSEVVAALKRDGAVIVEDMITDATMDRFMRDIGPLIECEPFGSLDFTGTRTKRCGGLLGKSQHTVDLLTHPLLLDAAE